MGNQRIHQSSVRNAPNQAKSSPFTPRPFACQARRRSQTAPTREEIESEDFTQSKFEAFGLQLQEKHGTIAPVGRERLGVLQAKINDYWAQRLEKASRGGHSFVNIPVHSPEARNSVPATQENRTGLPDQLKAGIESLSGASLDRVRVHYNSPRPAQLQAHAFAQGHDIHVAPGQEKHLPHEVWHVAQQAQGRVKSTMGLKGGVSVNDDGALENEATIMGAKALQPRERMHNSRSAPASSFSAEVIQRATVLNQRPHIEDRPEFGARKGLSEKPGMAFEGGEEAWAAAKKGQDEEAEFAPLVRQALARIEEAVQASKDTMQLAAKLEQIKADLGLKAIDMIDLGTPNARVAFKVNPWIQSPVSLSPVIWKMTGTQGTPITNVHWESEDLTIGTQTAKVGKHMVAKPLATDHEPGFTSAADSHQNKLMGELVNAGNTAVPNDQKYIKGHLLNDHVGGPGASFNLFPITADANAKHLVYVEKFLKAQLRSRYVVSYEVQVSHGTPNNLGTTASGPYDISSALNFYWHLLDATGGVIGSIHTAQIQSDYNTKGSEPFDVNAEYINEYDKLNLGKSTPKALGQTGQWQTSFDSPMMGPMGTASLSSSAITMPVGHFGATVPSTPDLSDLPVKTDSSGAQFISVRNKHVPPSLVAGSTILVGPSSAASTVTIQNISPLSGGWTRIYF